MRRQIESNMQTNQSVRTIGPAVRICQLNIESISNSKTDYLSRLMTDENIDVVLLQETRTQTHESLVCKGTIHGYKLLAAIHHRSYGVATYVKNNISNAEVLECRSSNNIFIIAAKINGINIINIYKPPLIQWFTNAIPKYDHPAIYAGDFNSHHSLWRYQTDDDNGLWLVDWAEASNLHLIYDAKDRGTFHSARWGRDYNPDLCFVSSLSSRPLPATRVVLKNFPQSQHRPVVIDIGAKIPIVKSIPKPRWNFRRADWNKFSKRLDDAVRFIPPLPSNYDRFVGLIIASAKKTIPRGFRKEYIPCWNEDSDRLYNEFCTNESQETADELLLSLDEARKQEWASSVGNMDFKHSSRKAWCLLRKLGSAKPPPPNKPTLDPNSIAAHIVNISKAKCEKVFTRSIQNEYKVLRSTTTPNDQYSSPFTAFEINVALGAMKVGTAAGMDGIYTEFLKNSGPRTRTWLSSFYSNIMSSNQLPTAFKKSKIIALLKPHKPEELPQSYRPVSLLSVSLKLLERLILNRIGPKIDLEIPQDQAGFRKNRSCTDQVLSLTNFIESGFQKQLKTAAVFVDLTAAYDTVWKKGLLYKLLKVIPCIRICNLISSILSDRLFIVHLNDKNSRTRKLNNGLPQGSVLAPTLFNLYIHDLPVSTSRKFIYADDMAFAYQHKTFSDLEEVLTSDLRRLSTYCSNWRLSPSPAKTEVSCFHLNHHESNRELNVFINNTRLKHNSSPKYLGITLDRTLSFNAHLTKTSQKIKTRNNIIQKLTGTSWGANSNCLRISALSLVYSAAEYGSPIWLNSHHTQKIDTQLNTTMRLISGTLRPTPTEWLPKLCNIAPPQMRRQQSLLREYKKIMGNDHIPLRTDLDNPPRRRLESRHAPLDLAKNLYDENFEIDTAWSTHWSTSGRCSPLFNDRSSDADLQLPRKAWCNLNRLRTGTGRTLDTLYKWGLADDPKCPCGAPRQTTDHILRECHLLSYEGPLNNINILTPDAISWLNSLDL